MELKSDSKYRLSKNGGASQIILFCHGAWSTSDGKVYVPKGMVVNFYGAHGQFSTQSQTIAETALGAQASGGNLDQRVLLDLMNQKEEQGWSMLELDAEIERAKANVNAHDMAQSMQVYETGGGRLGQKVYNYSLSYSGPRDNEQALESLFTQHQQGGLDTNIDLMVMNKGASGHLKSALKFALSNGEKYTIFHFLPCRYVDASDKKSMRTVHLPDFGDEDFIETSVL